MNNLSATNDVVQVENNLSGRDVRIVHFEKPANDVTRAPVDKNPRAPYT